MRTAGIDETVPRVKRAKRVARSTCSEAERESERKPRAKRPRFDPTSVLVQPEARPRTGSIALSFAVVYRNTKSE